MTIALRKVTAIIVSRDLADVTEADMLSLDWSQLRYQHTAAIRARLAEDASSPSTANKALAALRGVLKQAWRLGLMDANAYRRAADISDIKAEALPAGRELTAGEIVALVDACKRDTSPAGVRDAAILGLMYVCGLRRSELVALHVGDYLSEQRRILVKQAKGRRLRQVYISGGAQHALDDWLTALRTHGIEDDNAALFVPINKSGKLNPGKNISAQAIYDMLRKRAKQANVSSFSPHDLRRTFVGDLLDRGVDIGTVAKMAGHKAIVTTQRYDRRPERVKRDAADKLHFPY